MELATIILAMAEAGEEQRSEAPFFIIGGVLATFAVLISIVGFMKPDFPDRKSAARGVMAVGAVLMIATSWSVIYIAG